ncbi:MAG: 6-phosphofructokinase [Clostridiaceae bacterium]|nr:6-phosphofructokinase [Clostridiaceae bacterium]
MEKLVGNAIFGQSGGPTAVINSSAAGVIITALQQEGVIEKVYGAAHGIVGMLNEEFFDMAEEDMKELELLKTTPSSMLGSCRYKLANADEDDTDYKRLLEVFKKYNIRYFFYNGGNDSMDTCNKVSKYMQKVGYDCRVMGVPKTIDNDLYGTDHCPGFSSAAKYIATSCMEIYQDGRVYNTGQVVIVEIMGRNAGWLAAAAGLAAYAGSGPDFIYLPEVSFDLEKVFADIKQRYEEAGNCIIAVSEGVTDADGKYLPELIGTVKTDAFGHKQMGGTAQVIADYIADRMDVKIRHIELSLLQRAAAHYASKSDVEEAFMAGKLAVEKAVEGYTDYMIGFERKSNDPYECEYILVPLEKVANTEKMVPREWINEAGNGIEQGYIDYCLPLIQEVSSTPTENGLPRYARLKKVLAKKD